MNVEKSAVGTDHVVTMEFIPWEKVALIDKAVEQQITNEEIKCILQ